MKKLLLLISLTVVAGTTFGQWQYYDYYDLNFEDTASLHNHLRIDTLSNHNNLWQVGSPQKTVFTSASSAPNAIVTDTVNTYQTNDTSSFTIFNIAYGGGFMMPHTVIVAGDYYVNSDTLVDYGTIEFSPDLRTTWIDLANNTTYAPYIMWYSNIPTLTGNSNGWQNFYANIAQLGPIFSVQDSDTVLYRFTFISDSIQTNKDGLMFDNLHFEDWVEGIEEYQNDNLISISPNPTSDELKIHRTKVSDTQTIQIFNYTGQVLFNKTNFIGETIDTRQFLSGIYVLKYSDKKSFSIKKFVVKH